MSETDQSKIRVRRRCLADLEFSAGFCFFVFRTRLGSVLSLALIIKLLLGLLLLGLAEVVCRLLFPAPSQVASALTCICTGVLAMYRCLVQIEQEVAFAGPGRIVIGASTELAVPDITAARCEGGVFGISVHIAKVFTEGLGCDAGGDEIELIVAVVFCFGT